LLTKNPLTVGTCRPLSQVSFRLANPFSYSLPILPSLITLPTSENLGFPAPVHQLARLGVRNRIDPARNNNAADTRRRARGLEAIEVGADLGVRVLDEDDVIGHLVAAGVGDDDRVWRINASRKSKKMCAKRISALDTSRRGSGPAAPSSRCQTTIHATVQNVSGCACLDGVTLPLTFAGPSFNNGWRYASSNTPGCGGVTDLLLYCRGAGVAGWVLSNTGAGDPWARSPSAGSKCSPFTLLFNNFPFFYSACPSATVNVTITQ
jgi:hypothetical protein